MRVPVPLVVVILYAINTVLVRIRTEGNWCKGIMMLIVLCLIPALSDIIDLVVEELIFGTVDCLGMTVVMTGVKMLNFPAK